MHVFHRRREDKASKWGHLYWPCTSVALSNCVTRSVNNSKSWTEFLIVNRTNSVIKREQNNSLLLLCRVWTDYLMFMCRQTDNLWCRIDSKRQGKEWYFNVKWRFLRLTLFFFFKKVWLFQIKTVPLHHQNPPSLSTMLKCAGRFIFIQWVTESHSRSRTPVRTILSVSCSQEGWQLQILPRLRVISNILAITACQPICILCYRCRRSNIAINRAQRLVKWWCSIVSTRNFDCLSSMR